MSPRSDCGPEVNCVSFSLEKEVRLLVAWDVIFCRFVENYGRMRKGKGDRR